MPTLPRNIYPAVPSAIHLQVNGSKEEAKAEDIDADGNEEHWDGSHAVGAASNMADMFTGTNGRQQTQPAQPDEGVVRLRVGLAGDIQAGNPQASNPEAYQKQIEIDRFNGIRLDSYLPHKPGFMINAGGPVWGLDWAPQAEDDSPARKTLDVTSAVDMLI